MLRGGYESMKTIIPRDKAEMLTALALN